MLLQLLELHLLEIQCNMLFITGELCKIWNLFLLVGAVEAPDFLLPLLVNRSVTVCG